MHKPMMTDLNWLRAAVEAEEAYGGDIQIGGKPSVKQHIDPVRLQQARNQIKLYSLLYGELKRLLTEVDFGSGMEAAYIQGRQYIFEQMQAMSADKEAELHALLADAATLSPTELQASLRQQLHRLLNLSDWQSMTAAALAAVESKLLRQVAAVGGSSSK